VANYINVSWTVEVGKGFTLSVYFVEKLNAPELLEKLKKKGQRNALHSGCDKREAGRHGQ